MEVNDNNTQNQPGFMMITVDFWIKTCLQFNALTRLMIGWLDSSLDSSLKWSFIQITQSVPEKQAKNSLRTKSEKLRPPSFVEAPQSFGLEDLQEAIRDTGISQAFPFRAHPLIIHPGSYHVKWRHKRCVHHSACNGRQKWVTPIIWIKVLQKRK